MEEIISLEIYPNVQSNDFFDFYTKIMCMTMFKKVVHSKIDDYKEQEQFKVLFSTETYSIYYSNPTLDQFTNKIFMVSDPDDDHRHFLGVIMMGNYTTGKLFGNFVYFNSTTGKVSQLISIPKKIFDFDYRNGMVDERNTFLYHQTLMIIGTHRDTYNFFINTCCFDYDDSLLGIQSYYSNIKSSYFTKNIVQSKRFVSVIDGSKSSYVIDLGSTNVEKDKETSRFASAVMKFTIFIVDSTQNVDYVSLYERLEEPYSDGYEHNCVKCGSLTSCAVLYENSTIAGLGNSYCYNCNIRYSRRDKTWNCMKISPNYDALMSILCENVVKKECDYICPLEHHTFKLHKFDEEKDSEEKKPYKKYIRVSVNKSN